MNYFVFRSSILEKVKPIINDYASELGITVILEKNSVVMSADDMDMTVEVINRLDKEMPKLEVKFDN